MSGSLAARAVPTGFAGQRERPGRNGGKAMNRCIKSHYVNKIRGEKRGGTQVTPFYKKWKLSNKALVSLEKMGVENCVDNVYNLL